MHDSLAATADRLAALLTGPGDGLAEPGGSDLVFEVDAAPRPLRRGSLPSETWAVDGGQGLVLDARCVQVVLTRVARAGFVGGRCHREEEGDIVVHLVGGSESRRAVDAMGVAVAPGAGLDGVVHLLREASEWQAVARSVSECGAGGVVLVDGDLVPDRRLPPTLVAGILSDAAARGVVVAGVTKHSSLSRGGAPLLGLLELEAAAALGDRAMWWARVARSAESSLPEVQVVAARLDPAAPFAFRVDLPLTVDPEPVLAILSAVSDDAAFPGYPYPLSVADRLASCPPWVRAEVRRRLDEHLDAGGVPSEVRERAFADRHAYLERA